jgi:N6-L-threonylcarbamoyladenine synthase
MSPKKSTKKIILAIETSCDETAAAVLEVTLRGKEFPDIHTISAVVKSQIKLHSKMGGVVPEVAARAHVKNILPVVEKALLTTHYSLHTIDYIAVTQGPGLIPSLIIGVEFAKALSLATGKPIIPINHMAGHLYSPFGGVRSKAQISNFKKNTTQATTDPKSIFPMISLIVSGGHTMVVLMKNLHHYEVLGKTVDDAAGEAFDKVAKLLKLPYPGGPEVSKLAKLGKPNFAFPRPMIHSQDYNFSFAGLKTAVLYYMRDYPQTKKEDICKAFEDAVMDVLITKTFRAAKQYKAKSLSLSGGVSANQQLRAVLAQKCEEAALQCFIPPAHLSTDNAEMVGIAAAVTLSGGYKATSPTKIKANPNLHL